MKTRYLLGAFCSLTLLTACSSQPAKPANSALPPPVVIVQQGTEMTGPKAVHTRLPTGATATCVDGTYSSLPLTDACRNNGGIATYYEPAAQ